MTQIGVACNCHPTFEQFCVIEIGQDVELIDEEHTHIFYDGIHVNHTHPSDLDFIGMVIPEFHLAGAFGCEINRTDGFCALIDKNDDVPVIQNPGVEDMQSIALNLFEFINDLKDTTFRDNFFNDITTNPYSATTVECWSPDVTPFTWSEALS